MAKKRSALVQKLSLLLKISIFLAKLKKPMIRNLAFLKKTRKMKRLKQYNQYVREYEFSPSSTPLIHGFGTRSKNGRTSLRRLYSTCLGNCLREGEEEIYCLEMGLEEEEAEPSPEAGRELAVDLWDSCGGDDECVDERAEIFIQRFYEEMRRQRLDYGSHMNGLMLEM